MVSDVGRIVKYTNYLSKAISTKSPVYESNIMLHATGNTYMYGTRQNKVYVV